MSAQNWLATNAKLLGVVAAAVIFGSWLVENIVVERLKSLRDAVAQAESDKEGAERFFRIEAKLLEVYQVAASARGYAADARHQGPQSYRDKLYQDIETLERAGVTRDFAMMLQMQAAKSNSFLEAIKPSGATRRRVNDVVEAIYKIREEVDARRERYRNDQEQLIGRTSIDTDALTEEQASDLRKLIRQYREDVQLRLGPRVAPAANELYRSYDALFVEARQQLVRRRRHVAVVHWAQMVLYVIGSVVAIYASYLDTKLKV